MSVTTAAPARPIIAAGTTFSVLVALSFCHMLNDVQQSLLPAIYPILKTAYNLDFGQIGLITLTFQLTASLLQPVVGLYTDRHPQPYSLAIGMSFTLLGLLILSQAGSYGVLLVGAALVGTGSSVFHPELSRMARLASGGRHGFAQSLFQLGGNFGTAAGPLLAAFVVLPHGQGSLAWFSLAALTAIIVLTNVGTWYKRHHFAASRRARAAGTEAPAHPPAVVRRGIIVLAALMFSKSFYSACLGTFFIFYLIHRFAIPVQTAQIYLFIYLGASALGTLIGGPVGDHFGRRYVIWFSILGPLPFTLMLPQANLFWTVALTVADRPDHVLGPVGHPGVRAGIDARAGRHGVGHLLRLFVRPRRPRRRRARRTGRSHLDRAGLRDLRLAAAAWPVHLVPARHRARPAGRPPRRLTRHSAAQGAFGLAEAGLQVADQVAGLGGRHLDEHAAHHRVALAAAQAQEHRAGNRLHTGFGSFRSKIDDGRRCHDEIPRGWRRWRR